MKTDLDRFMRHLERRHPNRSTKKHYTSDLNIFAQFVGDKSARDIKVKDIDAFVADQSQQQLQPATINRRLAAISSFFQFLIFEAEDDGWRNPVFWKRHSIRCGHHLPRDVKDETAEALWATIDNPRDQAMVALMLKAGLRVGEVVALDVTAVEAPGLDRLARLRVCGKGDKERMVWLTPQTWLSLHYWLQIRPESQSQALFLNQHERRLSVAGVQYRLQQYCQTAGVQVTCHQLRHTFARRLAEQNMPVDSLAKLLGHNDLHTTQRYIEGADLTVRDDFQAAMAELDTWASQTETAGQSTVQLPFKPVLLDERPDPQAMMAKVAHFGAGLPDWLEPELEKHTRRRIAGWTTHQLEKRVGYHYSVLCRICRWLIQERNWQPLDSLKRADLVAYVHGRQEAGLKSSSIKTELTLFRAFWRELLEQELVTNGAILQVKVPAQADHLPRYLTGDEFSRLVATLHTEPISNRDDVYFNRAWFYLLAHGGLRISEALNLRLGDCDFRHDRLRIRSGKGNRDRVIPITPQLKQVLIDYLVVRESSTTDHLLLVHSEPVLYQLVYRRLQQFAAAMKQVETIAKAEPAPIILKEDLAEAIPLPDV